MMATASFPVEIRHFPEQRYVSLRRRVALDELGPFIREALATLCERGGKGCGFALFHEQVDAERTGTVEVGLASERGERCLAAGEAAITTVRGNEREFPAIMQAFAAVAQCARNDGRELAAAPREVFLSDSEWQIVWPLEAPA